MDVRVDEITGVRFVCEPYPSPSFPRREVLTVQFLGPDSDTVLSCYVHELYDGQRMCPEKLAAWRALRERYGNRDESRVDRGTLLPRLPEPSRTSGRMPHSCHARRRSTVIGSHSKTLQKALDLGTSRSAATMR